MARNFLQEAKLAFNDLSNKFVSGHIRYDAVLILLSGIVSSVSSIKILNNGRANKLMSLVVGSDGFAVTRLCLWISLLVGVGNLAIGGKHTIRGKQRNFQRYLTLLVTLLVVNFLLGLIITEYRNVIADDLNRRLYEQVTDRRMVDRQLGVSYGVSDVWDFMQVSLQCCGVESYKDYTSGRAGGLIPDSCCVMKTSPGGGEGDIMPTNIHQCHHDARRNVHDSVFLHARGCQVPLHAWFMRYTSTLTAVLFASICLQAASVLYLSWRGFMKNDKSDE